MSLNETQKAKKILRQTKAWKQLRHDKNVEQKGIDPITLGKITRTANCHHLDLNDEHYTQIQDHSKFVLLNKMTHDMIHWLYRYYEKDKGVIDRLKDVLDRMIELNK